MTAYSIRHLRSLEDYRACVRLQEEIWGEGFSERVPLSLLKVTQRLGGIAAAAFDPGGAMLGFVFGLTGMEGGVPVHWSDMLGVRPGLRDAGLGTALKAFQRRTLLGKGITTMKWTFDPLESRNAYLNFAKLGIVVREYVPDMYGVSDSPLHRGLGTDRFVAHWALDSDRVADRLADRGRSAPDDSWRSLPGAFPVRRRKGTEEVADTLPTPEVTSVAPGVAGDRILVPIPADIQAVRDADPDRAVSWRRATREALVHLLGSGFEVRELVRDGDVSHYILHRRKGGPS